MKVSISLLTGRKSENSCKSMLKCVKGIVCYMLGNAKSTSWRSNSKIYGSTSDFLRVTLYIHSIILF